MDRVEKLETIMDFFGVKNQKLKLLEECSELVCAFFHNDERNELEEIADISILIDQLIMVNPEIEEIKTCKINRTINRIEEKIYKKKKHGEKN